MAVVGAVKDRDPSAIQFVRQLVIHKLWDVGFGLVPAWQLDGVSNRP